MRRLAFLISGAALIAAVLLGRLLMRPAPGAGPREVERRMRTAQESPSAPSSLSPAASQLSSSAGSLRLRIHGDDQPLTGSAITVASFDESPDPPKNFTTRENPELI